MNITNVVEKLKDFQKSKLNRHAQSGGGVGAESVQDTVTSFSQSKPHSDNARSENNGCTSQSINH